MRYIKPLKQNSRNSSKEICIYVIGSQLHPDAMAQTQKKIIYDIFMVRDVLQPGLTILILSSVFTFIAF